jgi:predicted metal-dependent HD superfamily phosphohydrolase
MKISNEILRDTAIYVEAYMKEHFDEHLVFHNFPHTMRVVRVADSIAAEMGLSKQERSLVHLSAWFNDIGYEHGEKDHETVSATHARKFFESKGLSKEDVSAIESTILTTRSPQQPQHVLGRILCDADMFHLGDHSYLEKLELLRAETAFTHGTSYSDQQWLELNVNQLTHHYYFTAFARKNFEKEKRNNLIKLRAELAIIKNALPERERQPVSFDEDKNIFDLSTKFDRGVETLFKTTSQNHMNLSSMADGKANILISINSIILSVVWSLVITKLDTNRHLILPTIVLIMVCLTTIVLAILSTRPKIMQGTFTAAQVVRREANLLFFGNFHSMELGEYKSAVKELMIDKEYLYESLIQDIFYMGKVLARKYKYITWAYNVFMIGLTVSIITMIISFYFFQEPVQSPLN